MQDADDMTAVTSAQSTTSLNLKHYGAVTARDLENLPRSLKKLWIGPYFATNLSPRSIIEKLPVSHLTHLDIDLSKLQTSDEQQDELVVAVMHRATKLVQFGLRMHPHEGTGGDSLAASIARALHRAPANMRSLDLQKNRIGDSGLQNLVSALSNNDCAITHLNLGYNHLTSVGCKALAELLVSKNCRLETVDLSCNSGIDQDGFLYLVEAFKSNTTLRQISLALCPQLRRQLSSPVTGNTRCVHQHLLQCLEVYNSTLEYICLPQTQLLECSRDCGNAQTMIGYYLALNRVGRRFLVRNEEEADVSASLWPGIMARAARHDATQQTPGHNSTFYFLRNTVPIWAVSKQ